MERNESKTDRVIRLVIGLIALYLSFFHSAWWLILAVPAIITSITGYCHIYKILKISTLKESNSKSKSPKKKL
jgi:hypothetical protein